VRRGDLHTITCKLKNRLEYEKKQASEGHSHPIKCRVKNILRCETK
jgi:hypothetical protein